MSSEAARREMKELSNSRWAVAAAPLSLPDAGAARVFVRRDAKVLCECAVAWNLREAPSDDQEVSAEEPADPRCAHQKSRSLHECRVAADQTLELLGQGLDLHLEMT